MKKFEPTARPIDVETDARTQWTALLDSAINDPGFISAAYSAFHTYSIGNQFLALAQCYAREIQPGPLATFVGWKDKNRSVRKGEKAIVLCQPITIKKKAETAGDDDAVFTRFTYKARWFVLSQTDGQELPLASLPAWDADRALAALEITEIPFDLTDGNYQGYAKDRTIAISPVAGHPHKTRFHELAHVLIGHTTEHQYADSPTTPRTIREVEAEAVALIVCSVLGLPGAEDSRGYIQHWNRDGNPITETSARRIFKAADQILKAGRPAETAPDA